MIALDMYQIVVGIIAVLSAIVVYFIIPFIRANTEVKDVEAVLILVRQAVMAAEQIYKGQGKGAIKYKYVKDKLTDLGLSDSEIEVLIESAVKELNLWQEEVLKE